MTAHSSPSIALRKQRDGLRQKQLSHSRPLRAGGHSVPELASAGGAASDCVFKRLPAIGDTPSLDKQHW